MERKAGQHQRASCQSRNRVRKDDQHDDREKEPREPFEVAQLAAWNVTATPRPSGMTLPGLLQRQQPCR